MAWFRSEDDLMADEKVIALPITGYARAIALGTWIACGTWSSRKRTDGRIPATVVLELVGGLEGADRLVDVGIWKKTKNGYAFPPAKWVKFQPTRAQLEERAAYERQRKANWRAAKAGMSHSSPDDGGTEYDKTGSMSRARPGGTHEGQLGVPKMSPLSRPGPARPGPARSSTHLGNGGEPNLPGANHPPQPCGRPHDPATPCGACRTARRAQELAEAQEAQRKREAERQSRIDHRQRQTAEDQEAKAQAIRECDRCDAEGRRPDGDTCNHLPIETEKLIAQIKQGQREQPRQEAETDGTQEPEPDPDSSS